eukprot:TRINITY_DN27516_c0_g1_i1.p1 TRINITY_DN27516_c0_g1~~TRINITY_DN27516_c0_g1_i1.p1  ORF type:complete len:168 (-),score=32.97 TRINITY_DN27516_c0_g1_i1:550-1053(-)
MVEKDVVRMVLPPPPVNRRVRQWTKGGPMVGSVARLMQVLLQMTGDDGRFVRLASMAVLLTSRAKEFEQCWTEDMESVRIDHTRLEHAWEAFVSAQNPEAAAPVVQEAALLLAYREMADAARSKRLLPNRDELLVGVAKSLFGGAFTSSAEVEAAVVSLFAMANMPA